MVFNNQKWVPIHWGKIGDGNMLFTKMGRGIAYTVMYYHDNQYYPASKPFILNNDGNIHILSPDVTSCDTISISRKYPVPQVRQNDIAKRLYGGVFQVSDHADFRQAVTIHTINYKCEMQPYYVNFDKPVKGRYFRYVSADEGWVSMAEIEVRDKNNRKHYGNVIGTKDAPARRKGFELNKAFDEDPLTFYNAPTHSGCWVGLEFDEEKEISEIMFLPWNDDNFIQNGEIYELQYFGGIWNSLGRKGGDKTHVLTYENVPHIALLRLRNITKGIEERIFTYEDGKQIWW